MSMEYIDERLTIIDTCKKMCQYSYFIGTWGNVSIRVQNRILLTPSRVQYDIMKPEDIVVIDMDGNIVSGTRTPTSEKEVHRQIYLKRDDISCIIHAHTEKAMALSATTLNEVPCLVEEMSQLLGGSIPITDHYVPAEQHESLGKAAAAVIGDKYGCILRNHGSVGCGKNMDEAILSIRVVEKACSLYLDSYSTGCQLSIPQNYVESEHYRYLYKYGHEKT